MPATRHYAVNDRPIRLDPLPDGGLDARSADPVTGLLIPDRDALARVARAGPGRDVEALSETEFDARLRLFRAEAAARRTAAPLRWAATGDGEFPYAAVLQGRRLTIRINDFPAEPLYTLLSDGEEIEDLEDWPAAWSKPAPQPPSDASQSA